MLSIEQMQALKTGNHIAKQNQNVTGISYYVITSINPTHAISVNIKSGSINKFYLHESKYNACIMNYKDIIKNETFTYESI